ncbi:MAG TPA: carbon monoxide dehydrogenase subunit G [Casimicrobiaceae bacterium]|nr:carbon monoxide dehydrogenase subunit G [Casimicrobiaceae bacterium]
MEMTNSRVVPATVDAVWTALNDPAALKACIPGCESLDRVGDDEWQATVAARVGPVSARFVGKMRMTDVVPPSGYTLKFEGQGGAAGFANGEARVTLAAAPENQTLLTYVVKAQVGGKLAQIGSRLIDGAAAKLADDFFEKFGARFAPAIAEGAPAAEFEPGRSTFAGSVWIRYTALALILAIMAWLYLRGGVRY